jgi:hypothetical protein
MLSAFHESTIIRVRVAFGFSGFTCDPDAISRGLGLEPDEVLRRGEEFLLPDGKTDLRPLNSWGMTSQTKSKDVNVHLRELLGRLAARAGAMAPEFGTPFFTVTWKGNYLYAGSGPYYEADVLKGIAELGAELYQEIYQVDQEDDTGVDGLYRVPKRRFYPPDDSD